jgi:hypothetical protein
MRWPTAMLLAALGTAGCHTSQPTFDPFFPRTRIPPPATGAATGAPDAFYTSPTPPLTGSAPSYMPPATGAGGSGGSYAPPGGFPRQSSPTPAPGAGSYVPGPVSTNSASAAPAAGNVALAQYSADGTSATRQPAQSKRPSYVATADNQPSAVYERGWQAGGSSTNLAASDSSTDAIDIMDLPPVQGSRGQVE